MSFNNSQGCERRTQCGPRSRNRNWRQQAVAQRPNSAARHSASNERPDFSAGVICSGFRSSACRQKGGLRSAQSKRKDKSYKEREDRN